MRVDDNGKRVNRFFSLPAEIDRLSSFSLSWTIVHAINENSPLYGFSAEEFYNTELELMIFVKAFDEVFSNTVVARWSYVTQEFKWGARFSPMFFPDESGKHTVLDLSKLNSHITADIPAQGNAG